MLQLNSRKSILLAAVAAGIITLAVGTQFKTSAQIAPVVTPGMLFGPLNVGHGEHLELCASNLGEGNLKAFIHFRNLSTGEVTGPQEVTFPSGGGQCATYRGVGHVIGMARGEGAASDWVSPSNALISTMSVIDKQDRAAVSVLGVPKVWLVGL